MFSAAWGVDGLNPPSSGNPKRAPRARKRWIVSPITRCVPGTMRAETSSARVTRCVLEMVPGVWKKSSRTSNDAS